MGDSVPGGEVYNAGFGEAEDVLELSYGSGCSRAVDAVGGNAGYGGVDLSDGIQLLLHLTHLIPGAAYGQLLPRPGGRNTRNLLCRVHVHVIPVKMPDNLDGTVSLLAQGAGAPLSHPLGTLHLPPVAVLGENGLADAGAG